MAMATDADSMNDSDEQRVIKFAIALELPLFHLGQSTDGANMAEIKVKIATSVLSNADQKGNRSVNSDPYRLHHSP